MAQQRSPTRHGFRARRTPLFLRRPCSMLIYGVVVGWSKHLLLATLRARTDNKAQTMRHWTLTSSDAVQNKLHAHTHTLSLARTWSRSFVTIMNLPPHRFHLWEVSKVDTTGFQRSFEGHMNPTAGLRSCRIDGDVNRVPGQRQERKQLQHIF